MDILDRAPIHYVPVEAGRNYMTVSDKQIEGLVRTNLTLAAALLSGRSPSPRSIRRAAAVPSITPAHEDVPAAEESDAGSPPPYDSDGGRSPSPRRPPPPPRAARPRRAAASAAPGPYDASRYAPPAPAPPPPRPAPPPPPAAIPDDEAAQLRRRIAALEASIATKRAAKSASPRSEEPDWGDDAPDWGDAPGSSPRSEEWDDADDDAGAAGLPAWMGARPRESSGRDPDGGWVRGAYSGDAGAAEDFARAPEGSPAPSIAPSYESDDEPAPQGRSRAARDRARAANATTAVLGACSAGLYADAARRAAERRRLYRAERNQKRAEDAEAELRALAAKRRALAAAGPFEGLMRREAEQANRLKEKRAARAAAERRELRDHKFKFVPPEHTKGEDPAVAARRAADRRVANKVRATYAKELADATAPRVARVTTEAADAKRARHLRRARHAKPEPRPAAAETTRKKLARQRRHWDAYVDFNRRADKRATSPDPRLPEKLQEEYADKVAA